MSYQFVTAIRLMSGPHAAVKSAAVMSSALYRIAECPPGMTPLAMLALPCASLFTSSRTQPLRSTGYDPELCTSTHSQSSSVLAGLYMISVISTEANSDGDGNGDGDGLADGDSDVDGDGDGDGLADGDNDVDGDGDGDGLADGDDDVDGDGDGDVLADGDDDGGDADGDGLADGDGGVFSAGDPMSFPELPPAAVDCLPVPSGVGVPNSLSAQFASSVGSAVRSVR
jgi:hypothetical protein